MKQIAIVGAISIAVTAALGWAGWQTLSLTGENEQITQKLEERGAAKNGALDAQAKQQKVIDALTQERDTLAKKVKTVEAKQAALQPSQPGSAENASSGATAKAIPSPGVKKNSKHRIKMDPSIAAMLRNPQMKAMMRQQMEGFMTRQAEETAVALGIAPEDREKFVALVLEEHQQQGNIEIDDEGYVIEKPRKDFEKDYKALLGDAQYAKYTDYKSGAGTRMEVKQVQDRFEKIGEPLNPAQNQALQQVIKNEEKGVSADPRFKHTAEPGKTAWVEEQITRMQETNQRVLQQARGMLTATQVEELARHQAETLSQRRAMFEMSAKMISTEGK